MLIPILVMVAVLVGASMQRAAGMGFAMVAAPFMVLLLGPLPGVLLINLGGILTSVVILTRVWHDVEWRKYALLAPAALAGVIPGAYVARVADGPILEIAVGALVLIGLSSALLARGLRQLDGVVPTVLAGSASGFASVTAGVGGPPLSIFALVSRWDQRGFAATCQPFFTTTATASFVTKLVTGTAALPALPGWAWIGVTVCIVLGLVLGEAISRVISMATARRLMLTLAYVGSITAIGHGVLTLAGVLSR